MNCLKCGVKIPEGAVFCPWCGKKQEGRKQNPKSRGNGTGSVYKRGSTWCASVSIGRSPNGTMKRRVKGGFRTKKEAVLYLDQLRYAPKKDKTLLAIHDAITPHLESLSANKQTHYKTAWTRLEQLHMTSISVLSINDLQDAVDQAVNTYYPARDMRDLLSLIYQYAMREDMVSTNKAKFIVLPEKDEKDTEPFTAEEITALWKDYQQGNLQTGFFLLMIYTGMMPGELRKITIDMIDVFGKRIVGGGLKTEKRKQTPIILPDVIVPVVVDLMQGKQLGDRLCDLYENEFYDYFLEMKKRSGCRLIKTLRPYSCRHTTATTLADGNVSAAIIKEIMRHSKITSTQRYMHPDQETYQNAMNDVFKKTQ